MSKQRAIARAQRQARAERDRAARERRAARTARRRALLRRLTPPDRRTGRLYARRSKVERVGIVLAAGLALWAVFHFFDDLPTRLALSVLVLLALPAAIVLTLDRRI